MSLVVENSRCAHHEACPDCRKRGQDRSGNNLGVYDDGHKHCFACGYREGSQNQSVTVIGSRLQQQQKENSDALVLPADYTPCLPVKALNWLDQYGVTHKEVITNKLGWSQQYERVICPVYDVSGRLLFFQGRSLNPEEPRKAINFGTPEDTFTILGGRHPELSVVLVEDLVSAILVSRHACCMPLWGSNISNQRLARLAKIADHLFIWLDHDKARYSMARRIKAESIFDSARSIVTPNDPKDYLDSEIRKHLDLPEKANA